MKKTLTLISLLLAFVAGNIWASDYVDDINNASSATAGRQVIYEMNIGMFTHQGTFAAAGEQLAGLKTLGVDVIWLMPVYPRGEGNSPYAATDFRSTNPRYGTVADLKAFVARAHELRMQVWLDWVPNHTATNAGWVTSHPEYYTKGADGLMVHPNNYNDVWQLDYGNAGLVEAMNSCLKFWIDEADIDGYRCDYVSSPAIPAAYWQSAIKMIKEYKSGKSITFLGEADFTENGNSRLRGVGFDYDYAWEFQTNLASLANAAVGTRVKLFCDNLATRSEGIGEGRMIFLTNHDLNFNDGGSTLAKMYGDNRYLLTVLAFTLNGMPSIYNGQETGGNRILDYFNDTKIDWNDSDRKMLNTLRTLAALKHSEQALADGKADGSGINWVTTDNNSVLAYTRKQGGSTVLVVLNFADAGADVLLTGLEAGNYSRWIDSGTIGQGTSRKTVRLNAAHNLTLEARGYAVFVKGDYPEEELTGEEPLGNLTTQDEYDVFYECPDETSVYTWMWNGSGDGKVFTEDGNTAWPGSRMQRIGITAAGNVVYKYIIKVTAATGVPTGIIFSKNDGNSKTFEGDFVNHGYYVEGKGMAATTVPVVGGTGITSVVSGLRTHGRIYSVNGQLMKDGISLPGGIYIRDGKKFVVK